MTKIADVLAADAEWRKAQDAAGWVCVQSPYGPAALAALADTQARLSALEAVAEAARHWDNNYSREAMDRLRAALAQLDATREPGR